MLGCTQCREQLCLSLGPDAGHLPQPPLLGGGAEVVEGRDAERAADLDAAPGADPEQPPEPDQLRRELALELRELLDVARLDQLAQPPLDAGADPAQLARPPGPYELRDRCRRRADHLRGSP